VRPIPNLPTPPLTETAAGPAPAGATKEYILLIYEDEKIFVSMSEAEARAVFGRYYAFSQGIKASGNFVDGAPLAPTRTAKSVRVETGTRIVKDGPFAETREQLGGYYRVRARDLDEAIAMAARIPAAETGSIEIRPVMDTSAYA
jgi:hypothetical protein